MTITHPTPMTITIGYDLPFRAHAFTTPDEALRVHVRCKAGTRRKAVLEVQTHVALFLEAARLGMGAGARVPPRLHRRSIDDVLRVSIDAAGGQTQLEVPAVVDPAYVTVLLHELLGLADHVAIEEVTVELPGLCGAREAIPIRRGDTSELPGLHPQLPFTLEDERSGHADVCTLSILFAQPPGAAELEALREGLRVFIAQALQGGFIQPPMGPDDYFVSADDEIDVHHDQVTWTMESFDLPADAIHGLLSFLVAYHQRVTKLREVGLE